MTNTLKWKANKRMYDNSRNVDDMIFSKACLYNIDVMNNLLKMFYRDDK